MERPFEVKIVQGSGFSVKCLVCGAGEEWQRPYSLQAVDEVMSALVHHKGCALDGMPLVEVAQWYGL